MVILSIVFAVTSHPDPSAADEGPTAIDTIGRNRTAPIPSEVVSAAQRIERARRGTSDFSRTFGSAADRLGQLPDLLRDIPASSESQEEWLSRLAAERVAIADELPRLHQKAADKPDLEAELVALQGRFDELLARLDDLVNEADGLQRRMLAETLASWLEKSGRGPSFGRTAERGRSAVIGGSQEIQIDFFRPRIRAGDAETDAPGVDEP